jgi:hypothetical protein
MVRSYLTAFVYGIKFPFLNNTTVGMIPYEEGHWIAHCFGSKHGRWIGRWLHGRPTRAMIYKIFVLIAGVMVGFGYVCNDQYYRPITGLLIGTLGLLMFALWGVSEDDVR